MRGTAETQLVLRETKTMICLSASGNKITPACNLTELFLPNCIFTGLSQTRLVSSLVYSTYAFSDYNLTFNDIRMSLRHIEHSWSVIYLKSQLETSPPGFNRVERFA